MVVGNLLAGGRHRQLDRDALAARRADDPRSVAVLHDSPASAIFWPIVFGVLWGLGGLTFGLTMRYLGLSLGMATALGYTAVFGTLVPPIFHGQFRQLLKQTSGIVILMGVGICVLGILFAGLAGISKERELSHEQKRASIKEFNLKLGIGVATFCGIMSSCFAFGLDAGNPIKMLTLAHGTSTCGRDCPCWSLCWPADSPPTSSGA